MDGKIRPSALNSILRWRYHKTFDDRWELESYLREQKQILIDKKVFKSVTTSYTVISNDRGYSEVEIAVSMKEAWNIYPIPIYTYDSNLGMVTGLSMFYNNFAGTLTDLSLSGYYSPVKSEITTGLTGVRVGSFDLDFNLSQIWEEVKSVDEKDEINLKYSYTKSEFKVNFLFHLLKDMDYIVSPRVYLPFSYEFEVNDTEKVNEYYIEEGIIPSFSHMLLFDQVNWIGNLRQGFTVSLENGIDYLSEERDYLGWFDGILKTYLYTPVLNYNSRLSYFYYYNGYRSNSGDRIRGILDYKLTGTRGLFWNQNFVIPVVKIPTVGDLHLSPFIDMGFVNDDNEVFTRDEVLYTAGLSLTAYPTPLPNIQINLDWGVNLDDSAESEMMITSVLYF